MQRKIKEKIDLLILWINEIIVIGILKYVTLVLKIKAWNYERKCKKKGKK